MAVRFTLLFLLLCATPLAAESIFDAVLEEGDDAPLAVTITVPLDSLAAATNREFAGQFSYAGADGAQHSFGLEVRSRGRFRRHVCHHPPLKLDFNKGELREAGLAEFDKYKLVTNCMGDEHGNRLVMREYLAYRAYNEVTPLSFRVRLLQLEIRDADGKRPTVRSLAFIIESTDQLAARTETMRGRSVGQPATAYLPAAETTHALFQYLIGNADWGYALERNLKVLVRNDGQLLPVGYDFDFSGWVMAPYARRRSEVGQRTAGEPVYLGFHQEDPVLTTALNRFREVRPALTELLENADLPRYERRQLLRRLGAFYHEIGTDSAAPAAMIHSLLRADAAEFIPPGEMSEEFNPPAEAETSM